MKKRWLFAIVLLGCSSTTGCRSAQTGDSRVERPKGAPRDQYLIEGDELKVETAQNLYDVVRIQRPSWLTKTVRNRQGNDAIVVYLNDRKLGPLNVLREIQVTAVRSLQYLSPTEAQLRYGPTHGSLAAIVVEVAK